MKTGNLSYLIAFFVFFISFTQAAEMKVPSLTELAGKKAAELVEVDSPLYEKLSIEAKHSILEKKGTWKQVLNFINQHPGYVSQDLIASIPGRIWDILNITNPIQNFSNQVKNLSPAEQGLLFNILKQKTESFLERFSELTVYKTINNRRYELPIDFFYRERLSEPHFRKNYIMEPTTFEQLLIVYVSQKIQETLMNSIQTDDNGRSYLSADTYNQLKFMFDNLMIFAKQFDRRKGGRWIYPEFIEEKINSLLRDLDERKIYVIELKEIIKIKRLTS